MTRWSFRILTALSSSDSCCHKRGRVATASPLPGPESGACPLPPSAARSLSGDHHVVFATSSALATLPSHTCRACGERMPSHTVRGSQAPWPLSWP